MNPQHQQRPPAYERPHVDQAPYLTKGDCCSACKVKAVSAADGEMKVCPQCFALLWSRDYSTERREALAKAREVAREESRQKGLLRAELKEKRRLMDAPTEDKAPDEPKTND